MSAATLWFATPLQAQLRASWDVHAAVTQFEAAAPANSLPASASPSASAIDSRWLGQRAMGGALRYSHPFAQLSADAVVRDGAVGSRATGGFSALVATPAWKGFRISAAHDARHFPKDGSKSFQYDTLLLASWALPVQQRSTWQSTTTTSIAYARHATGVWMSANLNQGARTGDSLTRRVMASGITRQIGGVMIGASVATHNYRVSQKYVNSRVDTLGRTFGDSGVTSGWKPWNEIGGAIGWAVDRFAFDAALNARPKVATYKAAVWGEASAVVAMTSRVALVAAMRSLQFVPGVPYSAQRSGSLGLRVAPPALWRPVPSTPIRSTSSAFHVQSTGSGQYTITINVANARSVELAGDFTAWEAIKLRQVSTTRWEISLPVALGSHRCNVRIDGADWVPPPGVPSITDEFNGRVGLFVVE